MANMKMTLRIVALISLLGLVFLNPLSQGSAYGGFCDNPLPGPPPPPPPGSPTGGCASGPNQCPASGSCTSSPCYTASGMYTTSAVDLQLQTAGQSMSVSRVYRGSRAVDGPLGIGWTSSFATARLTYATYLLSAPSTYEKEADITFPEGGMYRYVENPDGNYVPPPARYDHLIRNVDGSWDLAIQKSGMIYHFDPTGALTSLIDDYGNTQMWTYDGTGRLQRVQDSVSGRYLDLYYGGDGRLSTIQDSTGRQVQYGYDGNGDLTTVTDSS